MFGHKNTRSSSTMLLSRAILVVVGLCIGYILASVSNVPAPTQRTNTAALVGPSAATLAPTLVVYSYAHTDSMSAGNLDFFLHTAVRDGDGVQYVIVVNLDEGQTLASLNLPHVPANVVYVSHKNECYDWGTYAWALTAVPSIDIKLYKCACSSSSLP